MNERQVFVTVCCVISGVSLAAALVMMSFGGPKWILIALLSVGFAAFIPIVFSEFRRDWRTISGYLALLGPIRFWAMVVGTVLFILVIAGGYTWLRTEIGWPEVYGFGCRGRGCWIENLIQSYKLLRGGSAPELILFALLWLIPATIVGCAIYAISKRRGRDPIEPMD